jgi:Xaa-Pro aminopeptidase
MTRSAIVDRSPVDLLFTRDFTADELRGRREAIASQIGEGAHLLVVSAPPMPRDVSIQDAVFYYFSGLETCHSYLLVEGGTGRSTLFLPSRDTMAGEPQNRLGFEDAELIRERLQVETVLASTELTAALSGVKVVYTPHAEVEGGGATRFGANGCANRRAEEEWDQAEPSHKRLVRLLKERVPGIRIEDACPLVNSMRKIKSPAEIEVLRQAGHLSATVMIEAMKATRPGITENRLQAIAEYVFRDQGHCGLGYGVIAAGGKRTWDGHYHFNNMTLRDDDVVLMDCGPDLRHYTSDIARVWPVNGVFDAWHRQVYGLILAYHKTLLSLVCPGALAADIYEEAARRMVAQCEAPDCAFAEQRPLLDQMIEKGVRYLNHAVGLSVHDAVEKWQDEPLREGFVCVVDPMVWCDAQHEYIRVEDTIVVTADGCERLTGVAPIEIEEIEALVGSAGQ